MTDKYQALREAQSWGDPGALLAVDLLAERDALREALTAMFNSFDPSIGGSPGSPLELARAALALGEPKP